MIQNRHRVTKLTRLVLVSTALATTVGMALPALAQPADDSAGVIEEIVVTARLREESAQDIGQSIRALAQDEIERAGIVDFGDIARRTAGLDFTYRGPNANEVSIRGVAKIVNQGTLDILGSQPVVSQFVDSVPIQAASSRQRDVNTFDMSRIEVLRGPQPTYFGEGSVGGTVRYFSNAPTLEAGIRGAANVRMGSVQDGGEALTVQGVIDATLVPDVLGVRVVGFTRDDEGFIDNALTRTVDYNDYQSQGGRVSVAWQPSERFRARAVAHFTEDDHAGDWLADSDRSDLRFSQRPIDEDWDDDYELYSLTLEYDFGRFALTSVTGYYERELLWSRYDFVQGQNSGPVLFGQILDVTTETYGRDESFNQELRLVSDFDGPVNVLLGAYYKDQEGFGYSIARSPQIVPLTTLGNLLLGIPSPGDDLFFGSDVESGPSKREQLSLFGEITWSIAENVRLIGGVRWMDEDLTSPTQNPATTNDPILATCILTRSFMPRPPTFAAGTDDPCGAAIYITNLQLLSAVGLQDLTEVETSVDGEWLPKLSVEWDVTEGTLAYASMSKGVRNGGLNSTFVVATAPEVPNDEVDFEQDEMTAYEVGLKNTLLDGRLVLNAAVFYNDWDDIQVMLITSAGGLLDNAGDASSSGFEVESVWAITDYVSFTGAFNYTASEFSGDQLYETPLAEAVREALGRPPAVIDDGNKLPNVPEYSLSLALDVLYPEWWQGLDFVGRVDFMWIDERYQSALNSENSLLSDYSLVNLRAGVQGESWSAIFSIENLTNELSDQSRLQTGPAGNIVFSSYVNRPRTYGLNLTVRF